MAARALEAGDELTHTYNHNANTKQSMLQIYGFSKGVPSASFLLARDSLAWHEHAPAWLAHQGCVMPTSGEYAFSQRVDLRLGKGGTGLTIKGLRTALRCARLRLYPGETASWALRSGHLVAGWQGAERPWRGIGSMARAVRFWAGAA